MRKIVDLSILFIIYGVFSCGAVTKKAFDFVIGVNGDFKAALNAASKAASSGNRFYIFFPNGQYNIGTLTGDTNQMTIITLSNLSIIGEDKDSTVIFNQAIHESISTTATLNFSKTNNLYLQDLTVLNKADYRKTRAGRFVAIQEQGDRNIYKNVKLCSNQDTYYSKSTRTYWETGEIHGVVDFICGYGDIFFNKCTLYLEANPGYITAPATKSTWGYVFYDCTIDGIDGKTYYLGRPWSNTPKCVYINTIMKQLPSTGAWGDPMNVVPTVFAEYNSKTASGSLVDLSKRRTTYTKDNTTVKLNPVLTASQAAQYTIKNVLSGTDNWQPDALTKQVAAPVIRQEGLSLKWNDDENVLCWVIFKDKKFYKCVTSPVCEITASAAKYTVRAANSMGGLGASSNTVTTDGKTAVVNNDLATSGIAIKLNTSVKKSVNITIPPNVKGATLNIISGNGKVIFSKPLENENSELHLDNLPNGLYFFQVAIKNGSAKKTQNCFTRKICLCR